MDEGVATTRVARRVLLGLGMTQPCRRTPELIRRPLAWGKKSHAVT
jgi:hypothetical protein